jgi:hypothetical protein
MPLPKMHCSHCGEVLDLGYREAFDTLFASRLNCQVCDAEILIENNVPKLTRKPDPPKES